MPLQLKKLRIAVLFGGRSSEHHVSIMSATNVIRALDPAKYEVVPVFITEEGQWLLSGWDDDKLKTPFSGDEVCLLPGGRGRMLIAGADGNLSEGKSIDILFPVLHGLHGEDGTVQGLADVARVPLAGCGLLGSAIALDKDVAKQLLRSAGLPVARSITLHRKTASSFEALEKSLGLPFFVKPARQGSSVGVRKITGRESFSPALEEAFRHDSKVLAEEYIRGREIEFGVLEDAGGGLFVSKPGEVAAAQQHGFYSFDAKYTDENGATLVVPARLSSDVESNMRELAARAFRILGCDGMARVDFFLMQDERFVINELNTIPGFTDISMYPKAMAASGMSYAAVIERLIEHGISRGLRAE